MEWNHNGPLGLIILDKEEEGYNFSVSFLCVYTTWKRKAPEYKYNENKNKRGWLIPINSEEVSGTIVGTVFIFTNGN